MTLQRRVLGYLALCAITSCALSFGVGVVLVRHRVSSQRLAALESQAAVSAGLGGPPGALASGDHVYRMARGGPRRVRPRLGLAVVRAIPAGGDAQGAVTVLGHAVIYAARTTPSGRVVLIRGARLAFSEWRPFLVSLGLAGIGGALLAVILSYLLARRLTRPIGTLAGATQRVAGGETGVRVPVHGDDELAELGRAFNQMSGQLGLARESQRRFLESVSHELKTPLTSIRGYAEALEEGIVAPSDGGRVINTEAGRLERLVFDLLDLARLGRAGFAVAQDRVDLASVAEASVERHRPAAGELEITLSCSNTDGAWALGDEGRLLQATSNLIENALAMTPPGGAVMVSAGPGRLVVGDTGPGLDTEDLPRAFERFYLHDRYRSEQDVGSGLGLAIVHELTLAMGGAARVANRPGGGAEFTLELQVPTTSSDPPTGTGTGESEPAAGAVSRSSPP